MILHYFGEEFDEANCNSMCDNCKHPKERYEGKEYVANLLKAVELLKETQRSKHYCSFLSGKDTADMKAYKHDALELFGVGKEKDEHFWNAVIRQSVVSGLLVKDIETYGVLKLTDEGRKFIKSPWSFMLKKERDYLVEDDEPVITSNGGAAFDQALYEQLVDLRKQLSKQRNIPPFVIFQEPSLKDMCFQYPVTLEELTNIQGVGTGKAQRYGQPFVALIKNYVEQNEIERPQDLVVKSVVNKSGLKVQLIQNIDRKLPLEDIGRAQGKSLDADVQQEIYEYFSEAETDDLQVAYDELDGDYSEEELRLMRIKFMSEMAN